MKIKRKPLLRQFRDGAGEPFGVFAMPSGFPLTVHLVMTGRKLKWTLSRKPRQMMAMDREHFHETTTRQIQAKLAMMDGLVRQDAKGARI